MEENVLIKSVSSKKLKKGIVISIISLLVIAVIFLIVGISVGKQEWAKWEAYWCKDYLSGVGTYYECCYCEDILFDEDKMVSHLLNVHGNVADVFYGVIGISFLIMHWSFILVCGILYLIYLMISRSEVTITDKNVYGKTYWGKKVVLPLYMISAYSTSKFFSVLAVATSSGYIKFPCIENREQIAVVLQQLISERQLKTENQQNEKIVEENHNNLDDLIKLKSLLDNGIITQEEFDVKKKQILGM